jgi:hypothetical protein
LDWVVKEGAIFDKLEYPAYFNGVCGVRIKQDIAPGEAFVFVPNHLLITVETALQSELKDFFEKHDDLFLSSLSQ